MYIKVYNEVGNTYSTNRDMTQITILKNMDTRLKNLFLSKQPFAITYNNKVGSWSQIRFLNFFIDRK